MPRDAFPATLVFIVLRRVRETFLARRSSVVSLLRELDGVGRVDADALYRSSTDGALLILRIPPSPRVFEALDAVHAAGARAGLELVDLRGTGPEERRRLFASHLTLYEEQFLGLPDPLAALDALGRHLGFVEESDTADGPVRGEARVRYRRGDAWRTARLGFLSRDAISVATACPPRVGDLVEIEITLGDAQAFLSVAVERWLPGGGSGGVTGFQARLGELEVEEAARLEHVLGALSALRLSPPPPRRHPRFPVRWPVRVGRNGESVPALALDVSLGGLFLAPGRPLSQTEGIVLTIPTDYSDDPVRAGARVARELSGDRARALGLEPGVGLELRAADPDDRERYEAFLERVERRATRSVVVGAAEDRAPRLAAALASVGYAASVATDPMTFLQRATAVVAPPDLVLTDRPFSRPSRGRLSTVMERALEARGVLTVSAEGQPAQDAWKLADRVLLD